MQSRISWQVDSARTRVVLRRSCTSCTQRRFGTNARFTQTQSRAQIGTRAARDARSHAAVAAPTCTPVMISPQTPCLPSNTCHLYAAPPARRRRSGIWKRPSPPPRYSPTGVPVCASGYRNTHNLIHRSCIFKCNLVRIHTVHRQTPLNGRRLTRKCMQTRRIHR